jgi:hypothetical protein
MKNAELIFEGTVKELKNTYTIEEQLPEPWVKKPIMKKTLYGVEIKKPTGYRIYKFNNGISSCRTWVFGNLEINPNRFYLNKLKK